MERITFGGTNSARFRITLWPGWKLPYPQLGLGEQMTLEGDNLVPAFEDGADEAASGVPPAAAVEEIYLELAELDLDDPGEILDFASRYRTLGVEHNDYEFFQRFPRFDERVRPTLPAPSLLPFLALDETVEQFRFGAQCVRDLVTAARILQGELVQPEWCALPPGETYLSDARTELFAEHGETPLPEHDAEAALDALMTPAMRLFHPRVVVGPHTGTSAFAVELIPLYAVCCLELYNHLVEGALYKICANENCHRLYVRQRGRAQHGQYRSDGVLYCSSHCARAKSQRDYRARQRAKRTKQK